MSKGKIRKKKKRAGPFSKKTYPPKIQMTLNQAIGLHREGRLAEAEVLYRKILNKHPRHPDGLHLLGIISSQTGNHALAEKLIKRAISHSPGQATYYNSQGNVQLDLEKVNEALLSYKNAIQIDPNYAEAHSNLGNALRGVNNHMEAEEAYERAISLAPRYAEAFYNLGNLLLDRGDIEKAIKKYQRAIEIDPPHVKAYNNLGIAYEKIGNFDLAIQCFETYLNYYPQHTQIHINLGNAYQHRHDYDKAIHSYKQVLALDPENSDANYNLGVVCKKKGHLHEAEEHFKYTLKQDPGYTDAQFQLANTFIIQQRLEESRLLLEEAVSNSQIDPNRNNEFLVTKAIVAWLQGDMETCSSALLNSSSILNQKNFADEKQMRFMRAYHTYLSNLLRYKRENGELYSKPANAEFFILGDSHCLSPHQTVLGFDNNDYRVISCLIIGCKAWHLANDRPNQYKAGFEATLENIPSGSLIIAAFGEIDCRHNEGILAHLRKNPAPTEILIENQTSRYINYLLERTRERAIKTLVCGVPAPNYDISTLSQSDRENFLQIVRLFNHHLCRAATENRLGYIDSYGATVGEDGTSHGRYHLDTHHLYPDFLGHALKKNFIST